MSDDNGVRNDPALMEALISAYSILSLLHHRGPGGIRSSTGVMS